MRRLVFRALLIAALPIVFFAPDAGATKNLPSGCDVLANTHCHCIGFGFRDCLIID